MGSTIVASKTSLEKAIRLAWLDDLNTFGEDSYVYNNDEKLKALFGMKEAINSGMAGQRVFAYGAEKGLHVGNALALINGIGSANWAGLSTVDAVLGSSVAMGKVNANIRAKRLMNMMMPYTQLEYIESTGAQYIDTGHVQTSNNMKIVCEINITNAVNSTSLFGAQYGTSSLQFPIVLYRNSSSYDAYVGTSHAVSTLSMVAGTDYTLTCETSNGIFITNLNGTVNSIEYSGDLNTTLPLAIFGNNINGEVSQLSSMKLKSFKIYDNGELVRDFIPVLDKNGVACLWDNITKEFFYNSGSGSFRFDDTSNNNPENETPVSYTELEYIEATGTQYIDTGFTVDRTGTYYYYMDSVITNDAYGGANAYLQFKNDENVDLTSRTTMHIEYRGNYDMSEYIFIEGKQVASAGWATFSGNNVKIGIFHLGDVENTWFDGDSQTGKLYGFSLAINGTTVRSCIPARDHDGVVCLYDKINGEFLYNAGTGEFIGGPEIA